MTFSQQQSQSSGPAVSHALDSVAASRISHAVVQLVILKAKGTYPIVPHSTGDSMPRLVVWCFSFRWKNILLLWKDEHTVNIKAINISDMSVVRSSSVQARNI